MEKQGLIHRLPVIGVKAPVKMSMCIMAPFQGSLIHPSQMVTVAAGYRNGFGGPSNVGSNGNYWSATSSSATNAFNVNFNTTNLNSANSNNRYNGNSVRLASVVSALALT